jgi:hypothetical protein
MSGQIENRPTRRLPSPAIVMMLSTVATTFVPYVPSLLRILLRQLMRGE